jgi:hypothetical protein
MCTPGFDYDNFEVISKCSLLDQKSRSGSKERKRIKHTILQAENIGRCTLHRAVSSTDLR